MKFCNIRLASSAHRRKTLEAVRMLVIYLSVFLCYLREFIVEIYINLLNYYFDRILVA
jgi:hypothetical protein